MDRDGNDLFASHALQVGKMPLLEYSRLVHFGKNQKKPTFSPLGIPQNIYVVRYFIEIIVC